MCRRTRTVRRPEIRASSITAATPGSYTCTVTAANQAGFEARPSGASTVSPNPPPKVLSIKEIVSSRERTATFRFSAVGATSFWCALVARHAKTKFSRCPNAYKRLKTHAT
jgi:hypothetical protein